MALVELRLAGLAVIPSARLELGDGLCALTGETGAGKSVCVAGLRLALGGRTDPLLVRDGCDAAGATAVFDYMPDAVAVRLESLGVPGDQLLTLSREMSRGGRGSCRVNGALVSQAVLREIGEALVEVTAQGESHRLQSRTRQRDLLDAFGGAEVARRRDAVATAVGAWRAAARAADEARASAGREAFELDSARDLVERLGPLGLREGEDADLRLERDRLRAAAALVAACEEVRAACTGGDDSPGGAGPLGAAAAGARRLAALDPPMAEMADEADDLVERLRDLAAQARDRAAALASDDERLAAVEDRLDLLERLRRRHGGDLSDVVAALEAARALLAAAEGARQDVAALEAAAEGARAAAGRAALELSRARGEAAKRLGREVERRLRHLGVRHPRFEVTLSRTPDPDGVEVEGHVVACSAAGLDEVEMLLAANRDATPLPLGSGPSGGEMSRLALCLRAVAAVADDCPTLVLDEVDSGIGGETAVRVGEALAEIGAGRQVVVITHRAEIAARATVHLAVTKTDGTAGTVADVRRVDGGDRVREVARLLSGTPTDAALARSAELLDGGAAAPARAPRAAARTMVAR